MSDADKLGFANPWQPMSNSMDMKHMGKLLEELGELTSAASRCLIQGIDEKEPVSGKINREWLEDEIADVLANIQLCCDHFDLLPKQSRIDKKKLHLKQWHELS